MEEYKEDLKNIRISADADHIIDSLIERYHFRSKGAVMQFALAYALHNYKNDIDFATLERVYPADGTNEGVGTIDSNHMFKTLIPILYPGCQTPYRYVRIAINFGLFKIGEKMDEDPSFNIASLM